MTRRTLFETVIAALSARLITPAGVVTPPPALPTRCYKHIHVNEHQSGYHESCEFYGGRFDFRAPHFLLGCYLNEVEFIWK